MRERERDGRQLLIIYGSIYSFSQDTNLCCAKVLHKAVIVRCPICFDQKTQKKQTKKQYAIMTDTHSKTVWRDAEDTISLFSLTMYEASLTCQLYT